MNDFIDIPGSDDTIPLEDHVAAIIRDIGIPPRPAILEHLALEMRKEEPDFQHMASLVERDVSLSAGLLKTVNAPFYGLQKKVRTVREALLMLGLAKASRTLAGLALRQIFPPGPQLERFWDASDRTAQLAGWLVHELGARYGVQHEDAYTFALFRDCGIPILMRRFPDYKSTLAAANESHDTRFTAIEDARLPTNHAIVGGILARSWYLPEVTAEAIQMHHEESQSRLRPSKPRLQMIALAQLAEHLFQKVSGLSCNHEWEKLGPECVEMLELDEADLPTLQLRAGAFIESLEAI